MHAHQLGERVDIAGRGAADEVDIGPSRIVHLPPITPPLEAAGAARPLL